MDDVTRSRSSSHMTDRASTLSGHVPPPPLFNRPSTPVASHSQHLGMRSVADEGFVAVLQDINSIIRAEGYSEDVPQQTDQSEDHKSTHVDGDYADGHVTDGDDSSQIIEPGYQETTSWRNNVISTNNVTSHHSHVGVMEEHHQVIHEDRSNVRLSVNQEAEEIYTDVIRPAKPKRSSEVVTADTDWNTPPDVPAKGLHGIMAGVNQEVTSSAMITDPGNYRVSGEWQEMVVQVGEDGETHGRQAVDAWAQRQATDISTGWTETYHTYQTPKANNMATVIAVDNPGLNINSSLDRREVSFTSGTLDNEGLTKHYSTERFPDHMEIQSSDNHNSTSISTPWKPANTQHTTAWPHGMAATQSNTWSEPPAATYSNTNTWPNTSPATNMWPQPSRQPTDQAVSVLMNNHDGYNFPGSTHNPSYGRVFPGTTPTPFASVPMATTQPIQSQTFPRPGALEKGIRITETDTWQRHADNRSVINIDTPIDGRSMGDFSQGVSLAGWSAQGSLNKAGSTTHPTMLATSAAYMHSKYGLSPMMNGGISVSNNITMIINVQ